MSETYLSLTGEGVAAKRGRNVEKYKEIYDQSQELYGYINSYIYQLNSQQFRNNSSSYQALREALRYLETIKPCAYGGNDGDRRAGAFCHYKRND